MDGVSPWKFWLFYSWLQVSRSIPDMDCYPQEVLSEGCQLTYRMPSFIWVSNQQRIIIGNVPCKMWDTPKNDLLLLWNQNVTEGTSLLVQWLRLLIPNARGLGSIPGQGTRSHILQLRVSLVQLLSCLTLCNPMDCSTPGFPIHHQLLEHTQTHVHRVADAIQPSHPLWSPSPPAFNLSQHQGLFQWVSSLHQVAKVFEFQLQYQSFQWIFRTDFL